MEEINPMKRIEKDTCHFQFDKNEKPVLKVCSGESVCFDVRDACLGEMEGVPSIAWRIANNRPSGPLYGPVHVEGAEPGDTLAVKIEHITLKRGFQLIGPNRAIIRDEIPEWTHYNVTVEGDTVQLDNGLSFHISPVIGTFGNAPAGEPSALEFDCGGNYDVPFVRTGCTIYIPVEVPGALFSVGDVHALQGDGEIVGAPEMDAEITAQFTLIKKNPLNRSHLMIESEGQIHTPAYAKTEFEATRIAVFNNAHYISEKYDIELKDALVILTMLGRISVSRITFVPYFNQTTALNPVVTSSYPVKETEEAVRYYKRQ
jgi:amidase